MKQVKASILMLLALFILAIFAPVLYAQGAVQGRLISDDTPPATVRVIGAKGACRAHSSRSIVNSFRLLSRKGLRRLRFIFKAPKLCVAANLGV